MRPYGGLSMSSGGPTQVHRAHVRDVETVHTIHLAHERGLFFAGKCSPLMSEVYFRPESAPRT